MDAPTFYDSVGGRPSLDLRYCLRLKGIATYDGTFVKL